jgi:hypothetical protein
MLVLHHRREVIRLRALGEADGNLENLRRRVERPRGRRQPSGTATPRSP